MGIEQYHPDPAAVPPTAAPAVSDSAGLPGMMQQLTRALLHVPADESAHSPDPTSAAPSATPDEVADETGHEAEPPAAAVEVDVPTEPPAVVPPAPRRPGAVLGELAFLDE